MAMTNFNLNAFPALPPNEMRKSLPNKSPATVVVGADEWPCAIHTEVFEWEGRQQITFALLYYNTRYLLQHFHPFCMGYARTHDTHSLHAYFWVPSEHTLVANPYLPTRYMLSSLWVLNQNTQHGPTRSISITFIICPPGTCWVFSKSTHWGSQHGPTEYRLGTF